MDTASVSRLLRLFCSANSDDVSLPSNPMDSHDLRSSGGSKTANVVTKCLPLAHAKVDEIRTDLVENRLTNSAAFKKIADHLIFNPSDILCIKAFLPGTKHAGCMHVFEILVVILSSNRDLNNILNEWYEKSCVLMQ